MNTETSNVTARFEVLVINAKGEQRSGFDEIVEAVMYLRSIWLEAGFRGEIQLNDLVLNATLYSIKIVD
jgi:hypothetical protein